MQILSALAFCSFQKYFYSKVRMLIFCSPLLNFIDLLSLPIKFLLKFSRLFSDCALNERDKCLLSFICSRSVNDIFINIDFPFMSSQQLILFKVIMPGILYILPFIGATFALFNSLQVTIFFLCHLLLMMETKYQ